MAAYGVPDSVEGVLPWTWAETRLLTSRNYWVTTVSPAGRPHSMPVWGVWLADDERFWFSCAPTARKARNLRAVPFIVVAPTDTVEVVSLEGRAVEVTGGDLGRPISAYWEKYGAEMGMEEAAVSAFLTTNASFQVIPERAFGLIERGEEFSQRATRWRWPAGQWVATLRLRR
jgi:hypothetical protein